MLKVLLGLGFVVLTIYLLFTNPLWGVLLSIGLLIYLYVAKYAAICIAMAMRSYGNQDINGCFRWFSRAEKKGMNANQKITYAYYLMREGRVERSEALLNSVLAFQQKPELKALAKSNHAILLMKTGRIYEAKEELEEIFPTFKNSNMYGSLGYLYILTGDLKKATEFNLEGYDYNPENAVILDNMVQLYTKLGDYDEAYKYACQLMEKEPVFIEAYYNTAVVEKELGKLEDAKKHLEHALTIRTTFMSTISHEDAQALYDSIG